MIALLILASASLIFVESAVSFGCQQRGRKTTEESWNCSRNGDITCTKRTRICSHDGEELEESGYEKFGRFGESFSVGGGGWDCRNVLNLLNFKVVMLKILQGNVSQLCRFHMHWKSGRNISLSTTTSITSKAKSANTLYLDDDKMIHLRFKSDS